MCNCGHLAQTITKRSRKEIHEAALVLGGEWRDRALEYCPSSGFAIDAIIDELLGWGLDTGDLADLENLADDRILRRLPEGSRELHRNVRDDVVLYLETWAAMLEEQLPVPELGRVSGPETPGPVGGDADGALDMVA